MSPAFEHQMDKLRTRIIKMGSLVDEQVEYAFRALTEWNAEMARLVMERDAKVDRLDFKIEKQCQRIFALQQPVARDLRLIMAALKINGDMERMGDLAFNIARSVEQLSPWREKISKIDLQQMITAVAMMVRNTIDSFVNNDPELAVSVLRSDVRVDQTEERLRRVIITEMQADRDFIEPGANLIIQLRHMERLADHATNIAEGVIFFIEAKIVRNRFDAEAFEALQRELQGDEEDDEDERG